MTCPECQHPTHEWRKCGYPITEDYLWGLSSVSPDLVGTCNCHNADEDCGNPNCLICRPQDVKGPEGVWRNE